LAQDHLSSSNCRATFTYTRGYSYCGGRRRRRRRRNHNALPLSGSWEISIDQCEMPQKKPAAISGLTNSPIISKVVLQHVASPQNGIYTTAP
jgi:hypothetical protein